MLFNVPEKGMPASGAGMSGMGDIGGSNLWDEKIAKYLVFFG